MRAAGLGLVLGVTAVAATTAGCGAHCAEIAARRRALALRT